MSEDATITLGFDVGSARIGVAIANSISRLPKPLTTLEVGEKVYDDIQHLIKHEKAAQIVIGLPRNLDGNETQQTNTIKTFAEGLRTKLNIPIYFTDEAVTSVQAETELKAQGRPYTKEDIDALAAVFILEDFLNNAH
jgi:putative Holliday junction resolvase